MIRLRTKKKKKTKYQIHNSCIITYTDDLTIYLIFFKIFFSESKHLNIVTIVKKELSTQYMKIAYMCNDDNICEHTILLISSWMDNHTLSDGSKCYIKRKNIYPIDFVLGEIWGERGETLRELPITLAYSINANFASNCMITTLCSNKSRHHHL